MRLYYHKTDGGAEYLSDAYIECANGHREGIFKSAKYVLRTDLESDVAIYAAAPNMYAELEALREECKFWKSHGGVANTIHDLSEALEYIAENVGASC